MIDILLGLDIGTTNIKAVAINLRGELIALASRRTPSYVPAPGQEEHDPAELWATVRMVLQECTAALPAGGQPLGLAISSMGEAGVTVSADGEVLHPFICWHDRRTVPQAEWWREHFGDMEIYQRTGLLLHPMFSLPKLMWIAQNKPEAIQRACRYLCVEDFAIWHLTGEHATSYPIASRTMAFNLAQRNWDADILRAAGLPTDIFPPAYPSGTVVGEVSTAAAAETGLPAGLPVATAGHDHLCAALAAGVIGPETALASSGTTETMIFTLQEPHLNRDMMTAGFTQGCHSVTGKYALNASVPTGGAALEWVAKILGITVKELDQEAAQSPAGAAGVCFTPHIRGSGTPHRNPAAKGLFFGLTDATSRAHLSRAALEGVAFELSQNVNFLNKLAGIAPQQLRIVGGGAKSALWSQIKADATGLPVAIPKVTEAAACGAALLAGIAVGAYSDWNAIAQLIPVEKEYEPNPANHATYQEQLEKTYSKLYPALQDLYTS